MRWLVVLVGMGSVGCAATQRVCPSESRLVSEDSSGGRVEWCRREDNTQRSLPIPGRVFDEGLGLVSHPPTRSRGMNGAYTHWYPGGAVESHGAYTEDGERSVPDGVWGFWYPDGKRKQLGRYDRGVPVGCFAAWDRDGVRVTGLVEGTSTTVREQACEPPPEDMLVRVEKRTTNLSDRGKGDASVRGAGQFGTFGLTNPTQTQPSPAGVAAVELAVRLRAGRLRIGPALGVRLSDGEANSYTGGAVVGLATRLHRRIDTELELGVAAQYIDLLAKRPDTFGATHVSFWSPLLTARAGGALSLGPDLQLVAAVRLDGAPEQRAERRVGYNVQTEIRETWIVGGFTLGFDAGLRLLFR